MAPVIIVATENPSAGSASTCLQAEWPVFWAAICTFWQSCSAPFIKEHTESLHVQAQLAQLFNLLTERNRQMNLTRLSSTQAFLSRHVFDAWVLSPFIAPGSRIADVGSGAGFPALPLAILRPDLTLYAIEATGKKARFIQDAAEALGLTERLKVLPERSEVLARQAMYREQFDGVTARALAPLPVLLEYCTPLLKPGQNSAFWAIKGPGASEELLAAKQAIKTLGVSLQQTQAYGAPQQAPSQVLVFGKLTATPAAYPRSNAQILKKPL